LSIPPGKIMQPSISPDDRKMLFTRASSGTADIFTYDFATKEVRQVTTDPDYDESGIWSPDSREVFHQGGRNGLQVTLLATADNSKPEQIITRGASDSTGGFGHDGKSVFVARGVERNFGLVRLSSPEHTIPLTSASFEAHPNLSPDGRWLAFATDKSGRDEVVLASYQDDGTTAKVGEQRMPVSSDGGREPHWRKDGREIVYTGTDGTLRVVSITPAGATLAIGQPVRLPIAPNDLAGAGSSWSANSTHTLLVVVEQPRATRQTFRVLLGK